MVKTHNGLGSCLSPIYIKDVKMDNNFCPACGDEIPADMKFCSDGCENAFYDESDLERVSTE